MSISGANSQDNDRQAVRMLLVSSRDWFVSALEAVLEPEGFRLVHVRLKDALDRIPEVDPDVLIVDEAEPELPAAELCRRAIAAGLRSSVPILVYSPSYWHDAEQAEAMQAGAWDVIREPIRSKLLVAKLDRLLHLKELIESTEQNALADPETGLYSLAGLMHSLPILGSVAERSGSPLSCAVIGPTSPARSAERLAVQRAAMAVLLAQYTRASDLCAVVGGADVALIAYDVDPQTAAAIVQRLTEKAEDVAEFGVARAPLSAGIAELPVSGLIRGPLPEAQGETRGPARGPNGRVASLARLAAAQNALREARASQGGIRIAASD